MLVNIRNSDFSVFKSSVIMTLRHCRPKRAMFVGPEYLTVSSSGPAGEVQSSRMGVYRQTGETHNKKPVWSRHEGPAFLYLNSGKFIL